MTFNAKLLDIFRNAFRSNIVLECLSKLNEYKSMFFFGYKKWDNKWKQFIQQTSCGNPFVLESPFWVMFFSWLCINKATKCLMNPIHHFYICIGDLKSWKVMECFRSFSRLNIDRAFSVHNTSKISQFSLFPHADIIQKRNIYGYAERLNPEDSKEYAIV